jgi:hypothetical protein
MAIELNDDQAAALVAIKAFLLDDNMDAFILRGSAGSGKTTLVASICDIAEELHLTYALLAPTGRAARILGHKVAWVRGEYSGGRTIHSAIYQKPAVEVNELAEQANDPGMRLIFPLTESEPDCSLFVIDESSMVGDKNSEGDFLQFGSGRLLQDLITHSRSGRPGRDGGSAKLLFVGDAAQLPPVGENASPALSEDHLRTAFGLRVGAAELTTVVRQAAGSPVLQRASELRDAIRDERFNRFSLRPDGVDIEEIEASRAIDLIEESIRSRTSNVAVVPSNAMALEYNRAVRERLWGSADLPVQPRETLLVNKNSRFHDLSNGDLVRVVKVASEAEPVTVALSGKHLVELRFLEATVAYRAPDDAVIQTPCLLLENPLNSPLRELPPLEIRALLVHFRTRYPNLKPGTSAFRSAIMEDPYFNALQVKYGYAMTCHKAQGGEWDSVLVHFPPSGGKRNATFFRWAYTAITRAVRKLIIVSAPNFTEYSDTYWDAPPALPPGQPDLAMDADWDRWSFSPPLSPLMATHQRLRAAWEELGIRIESLDHLQYCERYTLAREEKRAVVSYYYDRRHRVGRSLSTPGAFLDTELADKALTVFLTLAEQKVSNKTPFIEDYFARLDKAISGSPIRRIAHREMPYCLRVTFKDGVRQGSIDFTYDARKTWKTAREVGGPGASHGLYEEVRALMAPQES